MPQVVVATPKDGKDRTWHDVFPIWPVEDDPDYTYINEILESIAMNARMGSRTNEEQKAHLIKLVTDNYRKTIEDVSLPLEKRNKEFASFGRYMWYIEEVFANLAGSYREWK
jgi:hypothetical protein